MTNRDLEETALLLKLVIIIYNLNDSPDWSVDQIHQYFSGSKKFEFSGDRLWL
jgi:hypothetical protein